MRELLAVVDEAVPAIRRLIDSLEADGWRVRAVAARDAGHSARVHRFDAVLFDQALAGSDFLVRMRHDHPAQVLIGWSAASSSALVADLLDSGADEVVHGGMGDGEIAARIAAALRRGGKPAGATVALGALRLDPAHGEATWDGRDLMLTRREREVLAVLAEHAGRTVRREVLYRRVWGYAMARGERSVDVNVKRLRRKLAASAEAALEIKTQAGVGYRLELTETPDRASVTTL